MGKYTEVKNYIRLGICRRCINEEFGISLQPQDCLYYMDNRNGTTIYLKRVCTRCGKISHMLHSVRWSRRFKIWFAKDKKSR